ncbi:hypothetical protein [Nocardia wallacei]|uniref:hypothetical protein n=1 Tax=Nocardia wallacei TaxID=480035 RepID=UPI0024577E30|nr:hypothetical protein [Nocardia wallacei]
MTSAGLDPMQDNTRKLVEALTTARSRAQSGDGFLVVEACADGQVFVHVDDRALRYGGSAIAAELTRLAAQALAEARAGVREATANFRADPRIAAAVDATEDAMNQPLSAVHQPSSHDSYRDNGYGSPHQSYGQQGWPQQRSASSAPGTYDPYDDEDDYDPYYQRKSWLVD